MALIPIHFTGIGSVLVLPACAYIMKTRRLYLPLGGFLSSERVRFPSPATRLYIPAPPKPRIALPCLPRLPHLTSAFAPLHSHAGASSQLVHPILTNWTRYL